MNEFERGRGKLVAGGAVAKGAEHVGASEVSANLRRLLLFPSIPLTALANCEANRE